MGHSYIQANTMWSNNSNDTESLLTCTDYACIFVMGTVVCTKSSVGTLSEVNFNATAVHVIIPNGSTTWTKCSLSRCACGHSVVQLAANYSGITDVPLIVTNCAPLAVVVDLHTTFIRG